MEDCLHGRELFFSITALFSMLITAEQGTMEHWVSRILTQSRLNLHCFRVSLVVSWDKDRWQRQRQFGQYFSLIMSLKLV